VLVSGSQLGRYIVRRHLGAGGMGDVYLAFDPVLGRHVAIKVLPESLAEDAARLARFVREARAASALNHPGILTVHDFGRDGATHYLVAEYVDGRTLRAWTANERPTLGAVLDVVAQAATALAAAHAAGLVHRDVKPENLMVREDGLVKVLDFGIAKLTPPANSLPDSGASTELGGQTQPGLILGTVRYMSPEQASGDALDARTDVWSLGVVLYELVAGRPPFEGPTPIATLGLIMGREPEALEAAAPGTPEAVCRIVAKALRKAKDGRFETAAEMGAALERVAREIGPGVASAAQTDVATMIRTASAQTAAWHGEESSNRGVAPPTNLPPRVSALIARERELGEVTALVRGGEVGLVTLTGAGGTGKTRLAVEAARLLLDDFADGAFVVDLSTLSDPARIAAHIAEVFRLKESADRSLTEELERHLSNKRLLLVLDNFEHLLSGAGFVSRLLGAAPGISVLATSRERLRLSREREYALEPLEVPELTEFGRPEELARATAVGLFVERAREAKASFALTDENARAVVEICRRVDGLPLAIELAAARMRLLSPAALLERLERRLKLLTGGARDLPSRQQTMRGAVEWSYELLGEEERAVLRRMAVFVGGATLEAAEAVCGTAEIDVLEAVGSLVDKSLLRQRELEGGAVRFLMLEVVREYALEQLEASGEREEARLAHARYFLWLAEEIEPELVGARTRTWLERLEREAENIRAALPLLLKAEPKAGARLTAALYRFWFNRSLYSEGRGWLTRALTAGVADPEVRTNLLYRLSNFERLQGDLGAADRHAREAVEEGRSLGSPRLLARALNALGITFLYGGELGLAREAFGEGLAISRDLGNGALTTQFFNQLGEVARQEEDNRAARGYYEQALEASRHVRTHSTATALLNLGGVSFQEGDLAAARAFYREGLTVASELGAAFVSAMALDGLAAVAVAEGVRERAAWLAGAAEAVYEAIAAQPDPFEQALRDRYVAKLREAQDWGALEREWARGRAMTLEAAAAAALGE
jgi:predicted ATPase/serine/threonine protein kinase